MTPRIILSGGGTGGSVTPLLALVPRLRERGAEVLFVGSTNGPEQHMADAANVPWRSIPSGKLRRYASLNNVTDLFNIWRGYRSSLRLIAEWKPDVVVSAGSYVSVPLAWAMRRRCGKVMIHQQDIRPGLANRLMSRAADQITTVVDESRRFFPSGKTQVVGNPVRSYLLQGSRSIGYQRFNLDPNRPTLLVIGGGTGSAALNHLIGEARHQLLATWNIVHITGRHRGPVIIGEPNYAPMAFVDGDLAHAFAVADIVVSRAGMGVISELIAVGKPTILIPMPGTHQEQNAQYFADRQAVVALSQVGLTPDGLTQQMKALWADTDQQARLAASLRKLYHPDAAERMADMILNLANR